MRLSEMNIRYIRNIRICKCLIIYNCVPYRIFRKAIEYKSRVVESFHLASGASVVESRALFPPVRAACSMRSMLSHNATVNAFIGLTMETGQRNGHDVYLGRHLRSENSE